MSDNLQDKGQPDRSLISTTERWEVEYWSKHFGCTPAELMDAVKKVGHSVEKVQKELQN